MTSPEEGSFSRHAIRAGVRNRAKLSTIVISPSPKLSVIPRKSSISRLVLLASCSMVLTISGATRATAMLAMQAM